MAALADHESSAQPEGDLARARTRGGEHVDLLSARCTPADELDPETFQRLLAVLDRLP